MKTTLVLRFTNQRTIAEEFILAPFSHNNERAFGTLLAFPILRRSPFSTPVLLHCVQCWLHCLVNHNSGQAAVIPIVQFDDPERRFGCTRLGPKNVE